MSAVLVEVAVGLYVTALCVLLMFVHGAQLVDDNRADDDLSFDEHVEHPTITDPTDEPIPYAVATPIYAELQRQREIIERCDLALWELEFDTEASS